MIPTGVWIEESFQPGPIAVFSPNVNNNQLIIFAEPNAGNGLSTHESWVGEVPNAGYTLCWSGLSGYLELMWRVATDGPAMSLYWEYFTPREPRKNNNQLICLIQTESSLHHNDFFLRLTM